MKLKISGTILKAVKDAGFSLPYDVARDMQQVPETQLVEVDHKNLKPEILEYISQYIDEHKELPDTRGIRRTLTMLEKAANNPDTTKVSNLEILVTVLTSMVAKAERQWIFLARDGILLPYLVTEIAYHNPRNSDGQPYTEMALAYINQFENKTYSLTWFADKLCKRTVTDILEDAGAFLATPDMIEQYEITFQRYLRFQSMWGDQFWAQGKGIPCERYAYNVIEMGRQGKPSRVVNDGETKSTKVRSTEIVSRFWDKHLFSDDQDDTVQRTYPIPTHPYLLMFHLELHAQYWIHADNLELYQYNATLRDKLVLPTEVRDLIDILTHDMDSVFEDIVEGKSGGTIILCRGNPGTGKTLTAEVYAELIQKPLYKVQSGQLGLDSESLETRLKDILLRAERWSAVLLIDEADVYVHERGVDIRQNAVVGVFLRVLEYFSGLLIMTTNKMSTNNGKIDIDDAILRRCTAVIDYRNPAEAELRQIWRVLATEATLPLSNELIEQLIQQWPTLPGGGVKTLLKLVKKWTGKYPNDPIDLEVFVHMSQYAHLGTSK